MPEPRILAVLDDLAALIGATTPEQDELPTPCTGLTVAGLRRHLLGGVQYFTVALADPTGGRRPDPRAYTGSDAPAVVSSRIRTLVGTVRFTLAERGEDAPVHVPELVGTVPAGRAIGLLLAETLVHGWDLSRALDRPWSPEPEASEQAHAALADTIQPEFRGGEGMPFAPELPVPADASALERLLAFAGRPVEWTPAR